MTPSYAVLLKVHYWDDGVRQRVAELRRAAPGGELILFVDETGGPVAVDDPELRILRHSTADAGALGLVTACIRSLFWYCTDYPLYLSAAALDGYDYVAMVEHDVAVRVDLDAMVARARAEAVDMVADPVRFFDANWFWLPTVRGVYAPEQVRPCLTCFCLLSRAAWRHLFARRTRLSDQFRRAHPDPDAAGGRIEGWPFSEAFMATDLALHGFNVRPLSDYGATDQYDWWPPKLDRTVAQSHTAGFVHPVLAEAPYIDAWLRSTPDLAAWLAPDGELRRNFAECDAALVLERLGLALASRGDGAGLCRLQDEPGPA